MAPSNKVNCLKYAKFCFEVIKTNAKISSGRQAAGKTVMPRVRSQWNICLNY